MMPEISLNILDIAQNSVRAEASLVEIHITASREKDTLEVLIRDNGCGMTAQQVQNVTNPFFTTRTTRKVGLGVPFLKMAAEITGGSFGIESTVGVGTSTKAVFVLSSIDRMPLGDIGGTLVTLVAAKPEIDFLLRYQVDEQEFVADTREYRAVLGEEIPLNEPEVLAFITNAVEEGVAQCGPAL